LLERLNETATGRRRPEKADPPDPLCLLRFYGGRRGEEAGSEGDDERSNSAIHAAILRHASQSLKQTMRQADELN
jgi:hypothetical protein